MTSSNGNSNLANGIQSSGQSETNSTAGENSDLDLSENNNKPPVIYAWMKKVQINNSGNFLVYFLFYKF